MIQTIVKVMVHFHIDVKVIILLLLKQGGFVSLGVFQQLEFILI